MSWPYPRYAAHRGAGKLAPENTLAAMRAGFERGYRMVEFDVKLSADGVAFLLHDDTLDRTTNARGPADALSWAELSRLDAGSWHSRAYAGERIPTFAAVAKWAIANEVACNVEIKPMPGSERATGNAVALEAQALWRDTPVPPLLSSFSEEALAAARDAVPELKRALLLEKIPADWRERLSRLGCEAIDPDYRELTAKLVDAAREAGYKVMTYTPNDPKVVAKLVGWGVDCVITDAVDVVRP
ncbi:MAG TPA: glycerophosphodiester phosphodiesterase [Casimicrobiaceae bacterium]|nr:glycerophosphodiester phosphodiesterase [Casimicrobiaceae bacterium]